MLIDGNARKMMWEGSNELGFNGDQKDPEEREI